MDILLIKVDAFLPGEALKAIHDDIVKQLESRVVIIPSYLHPEIVNVPDGIEVVVEPSAIGFGSYALLDGGM